MSKPFGHPFFNFFLAEDIPGPDIIEPPLNLFPHINMILNVLIANIVRQLIENFFNFFFCSEHGLILIDIDRNSL